MKPSSTILALLVFLTLNSSAQKSHPGKPYLFKEYPSVINCSEAQLSSLFYTGQDVEVTLSLPGSLTLRGPVRWWAKKYSYLQTVSVTLTEFNNVLFSVTRRYDDAKNVVYVGHLYNPDYADGYELTRTSGNNYQLVKVDTDRMIPVCSR